MMENSFLRDLGCFARHLRPWLDRFPAKSILVVQFDAIRRDPDRVRRRAYEFLGVAADFKPQLSQQGKNPARAPRFPLLQSSVQRLYAVLSALPGADKVLKSPVIVKTLQSAYHGLNTKAREYEPLSPQKRLNSEEIDENLADRFLDAWCFGGADIRLLGWRCSRSRFNG